MQEIGSTWVNLLRVRSQLHCQKSNTSTKRNAAVVPYVNIHITKEPSCEQKVQLVKEVANSQKRVLFK
jgi:hypothetical protein